MPAVVGVQWGAVAHEGGVRDAGHERRDCADHAAVVGV